MERFSIIKKRYLKMPQPVKASFWLMIMNIVQKGINFIVTPIYTRILTPEEYGYYSVYISWNGILSVLATLNLGAGVFNNGMLKYKSDRYKFISSMQGLGNAATFVVFVFVFLFYKQINRWMGLNISVLIGMFILMLFYPAFGYWTQYQKYTYSYKKLSLATLILGMVIPAVSIGFMFMLPNRRYSVIYGNLVVQISIGIFFYILQLWRGKKLYVKEYWRFAFRFNMPLIPHYLSSVILGQVDRIMIGHYCGQNLAGIYSLAYTISLVLNIISNAIMATFVPWTYQKMKDKDYKKIDTYSNYILLLLGGGIVLGVLIAPELIAFLGTEEYLNAKWIIPPVMLGCYYTMLYSLFANIEFYFEKSVDIMIASITAAITNIILNMILIPIFGYIAAGYTTMACYLILAVIHYFFMKRICRKEGILHIYNMKYIVWFSVILTVITLSLTAFYYNNRLRFCVIILLIILLAKNRKYILEAAEYVWKEKQ